MTKIIQGNKGKNDRKVLFLPLFFMEKGAANRVICP